ncbi:MAG: DUF4097 family beta strand repeat-containing protein [Candidatus Hydrogenedentes bacterium]|nr:DUF4097 family beta strand repeat-containing protein [Candidatus Hydrogenedentota bacterium]
MSGSSNEIFLKMLRYLKGSRFLQNLFVALFVLIAVQIFTIGVLSEQLPIEVAKPYYYDSKSFVFEPRETLAIDNVDGSINVITSPRTKILVNAEVKGYPRRFKDREKVLKFAKTLFQVIESEKRISIETEPRSRPEGVEFRVDYQIYVPLKINLEINTISGGNITVDKGCKDIYIRANRSDIFIDGPLGQVNVQTILGRVDIREIIADSEIQTINGSIYLTGAKGKLKANSINGNVQLTILSEEVQSCDISVTNGNITIGLPELYDGLISARTHRGYILSDFQLGEIAPGSQVRQVEYQRGQPKLILKLSTMNGKILISRLIQES